MVGVCVITAGLLRFLVLRARSTAGPGRPAGARPAPAAGSTRHGSDRDAGRARGAWRARVRRRPVRPVRRARSDAGGRSWETLARGSPTPPTTAGSTSGTLPSRHFGTRRSRARGPAPSRTSGRASGRSRSMHVMPTRSTRRCSPNWVWSASACLGLRWGRSSSHLRHAAAGEPARRMRPPSPRCSCGCFTRESTGTGRCRWSRCGYSRSGALRLRGRPGTRTAIALAPARAHRGNRRLPRRRRRPGHGADLAGPSRRQRRRIRPGRLPGGNRMPRTRRSRRWASGPSRTRCGRSAAYARGVAATGYVTWSRPSIGIRRTGSTGMTSRSHAAGLDSTLARLPPRPCASILGTEKSARLAKRFTALRPGSGGRRRRSLLLGARPFYLSTGEPSRLVIVAIAGPATSASSTLCWDRDLDFDFEFDLEFDELRKRCAFLTTRPRTRASTSTIRTGTSGTSTSPCSTGCGSCCPSSRPSTSASPWSPRRWRPPRR